MSAADRATHARTDSAGVPWQGRTFENHTGVDDDGSAPGVLIEALDRFRSGELGEAEVVAALRECRLLIPLVAALGEAGTDANGMVVDKRQDLSIVTVAARDGRPALPVFTSVEAMSRWNQKARPVPADAVRVALAAAGENTDIVVLDPGSPSEFVLRRPALWAIAQSRPWRPCYLDEEILAAFLSSAEPENSIAAIHLSPGDPDARLAGAELVVSVSIHPGLDRQELDALILRLQERWSRTSLIADRVDSIHLQLQLDGMG